MSGAQRGRLPATPITWELLIDEYSTWMRAVGRSPLTIRLREDQLRLVAREVGGHPNAVTEDDLVTWFACYPDWKAETRRSHRAAVRGFFEWAYKFGRILSNPAADLPTMPVGVATPRPADDYAWRTALAAADLRVTLMLRLAGEVGLRRAEVAQVHTRDLINGVAGAQLIVHGKGNKKRVVPLSQGLADLIRLGAEGHTPGASPSGWLFPDGFGGHLSAQYVGRLVADVLPDGLTMHTLRHRAATRAYRGTRNLRAVQMLLGHSSVATTQRYTAVEDDEVRAAMMAASISNPD
ncbi:tyrosine-type recombinase/integrase [Mycobacterium sp. 4D054]|uniref:tyrosine-type recombinase/integrase n=1 Tax=Mycobacterium sp. 4D054 TaxID=3457440 RepID=UPI003FD589BD